MPTFRTAPSKDLTSSIRRLVASRSANSGPLLEIQADQAAATTAQHLGLAEKARAEAEALRNSEAQRNDPALRTEYAAHAAGVDLPDANRLMGAIRGRLEQPGPSDQDDAAAMGHDATAFPMARPNLQPGQEGRFRSALASTIGNLIASGKTNAEQMADAGAKINNQDLVNQAANAPDVPAGNRIIAAVSGKLREPFKTNAQGTVLNEETGVLDERPKLAQVVREHTSAQAEKERAAAVASRAHADLFGAQALGERAEAGRGGKPPAGYRWGGPGADGLPTLVKIPGGPADDKATSSDAERIAAGYATRMESAAKILNDLETKGIGKPGMVEAAARGAGAETTANTISTTERQQYRQAQEDWVRAKLRKESGAVIANDEMEREIRVYFPQIGDKAEVLTQKAAARKTAEKAMKVAAGRAGPKGDGAKPTVPSTNAKGWKLHKDASGNQAYVSPDGKQFEEVQ